MGKRAFVYVVADGFACGDTLGVEGKAGSEVIVVPGTRGMLVAVVPGVRVQVRWPVAYVQGDIDRGRHSMPALPNVLVEHDTDAPVRFDHVGPEFNDDVLDRTARALDDELDDDALADDEDEDDDDDIDPVAEFLADMAADTAYRHHGHFDGRAGREGVAAAGDAGAETARKRDVTADLRRVRRLLSAAKDSLDEVFLFAESAAEDE